MASTVLSRTQVTGNRQIFTYSAWIKRTALGEGFLFQGYTSTSSFVHIKFDGNNKLQVFGKTGGSDQMDLVTSRVFRDVGSFYNVVVAIDTTQATDTNRVKVYINGVQETSFSTTSYPSVNANLEINVSGYTNYIGAQYGTQAYYGGLMSQVIFVDGTAYDASTFGSTDSTSGEWKPNANPTVSYGNNGFKLTFEDTSNLGDDTSGNTNDFTMSGTGTSTLDNPSNAFATMNPLDNYYAGSTFTNGNLSVSTLTSSDTFNNSTLGYATGKYYWETKNIRVSTNNYNLIGITSKGSTASNNYMMSSLYSVVLKQDGVLWQNAGSGSGVVSGWSGSSYTTGDIIGIAHDATNNKIYIHKNGVYMNSGNPSTGANGITTTASSSTDTGFWLAAVGDEISSGTSSQYALNFGNGYFGTTAVSSAGTPASTPGTFEYDVPNGYQPLTTKGLNT